MRVSLSGHRMERLEACGYSEENIQDLIKVIEDKLVRIGCTDAYCGMAEGSDILFARAVLNLKDKGLDIRLHCILPCKDYNKSNPYYFKIKEASDSWVYLSEQFYKGCDEVRDKQLVNNCETLLVIFDGVKVGGVWSTIKKAKRQNKEIINLLEERKNGRN